MSTAFFELLSEWAANQPNDGHFSDDKTQIWIIGSRENVIHTMNEFCVKRIAPDRAKFSPIVAAPFAPGAYLVILER
jgi:hypothetical protein